MRRRGDGTRSKLLISFPQCLCCSALSNGECSTHSGRAVFRQPCDLQPEFRGIAYTTLMTTLERLYRKQC